MDHIRDDARIIQQSLSDPSAFAAVYDRHAPVLLTYLSRRVGVSDAEGLLGELFRIAFESRARYDTTRPNARPWLYGIAANLVLNHYRSRGRNRAAVERLAHRGEDPLEPFDERIAEDAATLELLRRVVAVIAGLPDHDREVVFLYAWEDLSYEQIAAALDIPIGTVRSRLNRVRTRLRELRAGSGQEPTDATRRAPGGESNE